MIRGSVVALAAMLGGQARRLAEHHRDSRLISHRGFRKNSSQLIGATTLSLFGNIVV
jgi:hypothetical protein